MEQDSENSGNFPQQTGPVSEELPKDSEVVGNGSEDTSETGPEFRKRAERTEDHTMTVRESAKVFEEAGMPVTERTVINWCNPNKRGIVRLDCYFHEGDGKYFITPQSIEQVIKEDSPKAKQTKQIPFVHSEGQGGVSEPVGKASEERPKASEEVPKDSEAASESFGNGAEGPAGNGGGDSQTIRELRQQLIDEKIMNRGKDFFIEQLQSDRAMLLEQTVSQGRRIGQLETELRQLQAPRRNNQDYGQPSNKDEYVKEESPQAGGQVGDDEQGQREGWQEG